ncbi:aminotransferase class I/II-fold pyridoxal phosphate-dependent enzyme [Flavobacterium sp.]|uniref:pyridoxal phosphate-dependent decarboxylase family protein n=1 Tax=Flavobacterium sp. TaxID=239 RepID=UPI002D1B2FC1|nr:aminotransferase class I/II-fold pyridoxal phosphate-dependent enzyme [Flavobacterium sp.]HQA74361.1 aminotransferase class I/II-fold pyridoxal phosphate-dependent enzyme [Flavobacterium sp.]
MKTWKKTTQSDRLERITKALSENVNFSNDVTLGYPASKLDGKVFYDDASFLKDAPVLMTYVANPNHIGCHTVGISEKAFKGTQEIEREVLEILAVDVFKATTNDYDGYIATGGTEANIEALWIYRNYFINTHQAKPSEIMIITSEDTHYSIAKGSNLLMVDWMKVDVHFENRKINETKFETALENAMANGKKYFIVVANMGTTMFGSVDNPDAYTTILEKHNLHFKLHVDAAYGGFIYPFLTDKNQLDFSNPHVSSITIDAHKMLQAPYGTGIFLCRKNLIENVLTKEAAYVEGMDLTLCGSRSGANAVAVWMILKTYGKNGWFEKVKILEMRTDWLCKQLDALHITYFREPFMNIVTIKAAFISPEIAHHYDLVPDSHQDNNHWYKIVLMEHVEVGSLQELINTLKTTKT